MTYHFPSVENLVSTMRHAGCHSSSLNLAKLAAGQPWTTEQAIREEFLRQEERESLTPVETAGVDE